MKVAVYHNNHDVRIEDRPIPKPNHGEILVKTKACGVCVADTMEWYLSPRAPLTLGHEPSGIIEAIGTGVTLFKPGDRVAVHHHVPCLICEHCRRGNFTMCSMFRKTNIHPGVFPSILLPLQSMWKGIRTFFLIMSASKRVLLLNLWPALSMPLKKRVFKRVILLLLLELALWG